MAVRSAHSVQEDEDKDEYEITHNSACWFMDYLASVVEGSGEIAIGSMITLLVLGCGADLSELMNIKLQFSLG